MLIALLNSMYDSDQRKIIGSVATVQLSDTAHRIMMLLLNRRGCTVSADNLISIVWNLADMSAKPEATLRVYIHRLRSQLREAGETGEVILTSRSNGYMIPAADKQIIKLDNPDYHELLDLLAIHTDQRAKRMYDLCKPG
jgi:DNA-binding response OmpR family regulator